MRKWAILIGVGLALFPIHNRFLTDLVSYEGQVLFFIPAIGFVLVIMGSGFFIYTQWAKVKAAGLGDRKVFIPLIVIAACIALSGIGVDGFSAKISLIGIGTVMFALYIASRVLGKDIFLPLAIGAAIASVGVIIYGLIFKVEPSGGFIFEQNYDIIVGYVLLGAALFVHRGQAVLAALAMVAMFLSGSPEALLPIGIVGLAMLIRWDFSKKLALTLLPVIIVIAVWFGFGWGQQLYTYTADIVEGASNSSVAYNPLTFRLSIIKNAMENITPFGTGYVITEFSNVRNVHNVPLVIVQQLGYPGIIAALAWLWVTLYCLIKTKWKYAWLLIISLSVFDHFIWTQLCLLWWAIAGVTTASNRSDLIFREAK